ncbi:MAG: hypothetical protein V4699_00735 [Patescibacteria group bacterium]
MDQNFQTSFIPKKPIIEERATPTRSVGILTVVSIFILFTVVLATGGLYLWQAGLKKNIVQMEINLNIAKNRFEPSKIAELKLLDRRLNAATEILSKHISTSPIFEALSEITMKTVRYTKFNYSVGTNGKVDVKMSGVAVGYRSVALQSDLFAENQNLIDPVFSNLTLDEKGNVLFDLEFTVEPSFVNYKQTLQAAS